MPELKGYPIIYPPDGLYYVYSKECGWFWRQHGKEVEGGMIDCDALGPASPDNNMDNRIVQSLYCIMLSYVLTCA